MTRTVFDDEHDEREMALRWRRAMTETRAVYEKADALWKPYTCPASGECCQLAKTQRPPWLWPSEWKVLEARLRRDGRPVPPARADGACRLLDGTGKRCSVYGDRPLGCRTFFCGRIIGPARLPDEGTNALMERLRAVNVASDDRAEPLDLEGWLASASSPVDSDRPQGLRNEGSQA